MKQHKNVHENRPKGGGVQCQILGNYPQILIFYLIKYVKCLKSHNFPKSPKNLWGYTQIPKRPKVPKFDPFWG